MRAFSGGLAVLTLLGMILTEFLVAGLTIAGGRIEILLLLIGALLGLDVLGERLTLPVRIEVGSAEDDAEPTEDVDD